jgi:hypothetical protein
VAKQLALRTIDNTPDDEMKMAGAAVLGLERDTTPTTESSIRSDPTRNNAFQGNNLQRMG